MEIDKTYTLDELKQFDDSTLLSIIKEQHGISSKGPIRVWGTLNKKYKDDEVVYCKIDDVKTVDSNSNVNLEYPINDLPERDAIVNNGIYIPKRACEYLEAGDKVMCHVSLSHESQRSKHNNPMLLSGISSTVELLKEIPLTDIDFNGLPQDDKLRFVTKSIVDAIVFNNKEKIERKFEKEKVKEEEKLKEKIEQSYFEEKAKLEDDISTLKGSIIEKKEKSSGLEKSIKLLNTDLEAQYITRLDLLKGLEVLNIDKISLVNEIKIQNKNKVEILSELEKLGVQKELEKELMSRKLEQFRSFVKAKADVLLSLEFIDKDEYDEILMKKEPDKDDNQIRIDFHTDLGGDFSKAVAHIQAYLFEKGIMYPKYIIEDFFALIQTNDLIILAGESGSGKTNLVKSFAEAVGGKYKIIPVKPNWTSSEDLLGYYNPLEKKYLSTPFLDALLEANRNPDTPYYICLDEMNLARVEYYFADFLSLLEERSDDVNAQPEIHLYSDTESSHILSEFSNVLQLIESSKDKYKKGHIVDFVKILQDEDINKELKRVFGFSDKDSLIKYHSDLRRMLSGIINIPSSITFPKNVRIIGAINIDETTHYLSPKIIDRAHIMKFGSPLLFDWAQILSEINSEENHAASVKFKIDDFGTRKTYPKFEMNNDFCKLIVELTKEFFTPLGIEVGLRTIRQGLNYQEKLQALNSDNSLFINNFFIHKILPKMTFDGNKKVGEVEKKDLLANLQSQLTTRIIKEEISKTEGIAATDEFNGLISKAEANDWIVNYWA